MTELQYDPHIPEFLREQMTRLHIPQPVYHSPGEFVVGTVPIPIAAYAADGNDEDFDLTNFSAAPLTASPVMAAFDTTNNPDVIAVIAAAGLDLFADETLENGIGVLAGGAHLDFQGQRENQLRPWQLALAAEFRPSALTQSDRYAVQKIPRSRLVRCPNRAWFADLSSDTLRFTLPTVANFTGSVSGILYVSGIWARKNAIANWSPDAKKFACPEPSADGGMSIDHVALAQAVLLGEAAF